MQPRRPQPRAVTGRALVLGTIVMVLLVLLASPLHRYFGSRSDVQHAAEQLKQDQEQLAQLNAQLKKWSDPGYIQQQARARLQYAMPGDTVYIVIGPGHKTALDGEDDGQQAATPPAWNQKLWQSVLVAGQ